MNWVNQAGCRAEDPDLFFPVGSTDPNDDQLEEAKAVCIACSVREMCLDWSMDTNQEIGVWGGLSEEERRAMKRARRKRDRVAVAS